MSPRADEIDQPGHRVSGAVPDLRLLFMATRDANARRLLST
jgi:hypothetical protein